MKINRIWKTILEAVNLVINLILNRNKNGNE